VSENALDSLKKNLDSIERYLAVWEAATASPPPSSTTSLAAPAPSSRRRSLYCTSDEEEGDVEPNKARAAPSNRRRRHRCGTSEVKLAGTDGRRRRSPTIVLSSDDEGQDVIDVSSDTDDDGFPVPKR
jgi:hypothetical protein